MKIAFNPSTVAALIAPPNNKDITFDLRGHNIFARGVKFCGTDTNTWRDIKINNVSIDSNILDLRDGDNTTLTNINGVVTINSTWRPVVDNLTSNSTTSSLSANLGRILKALIDGKSNSGHTHDDRYLKLTGGTMQLGEGLKFHADDNYFGINSDARIISLLDGNDKVCDGGLIIDERATYNGTEYVTELLRIRDSEFKWKGSNILHSGNSNINGNTITINGSSLTVSKSDHTHSIYAVNENYGGFKKAGRLPTSGFYQSLESESGGNAPWSDWVHLINCLHSNTGNNFALLIAASFFDNNTFKIRVTNNSTNNPWRDIIHSGNIGNQTVASATKLATARTIWGQSFDGTNNINGTFYFTNGDATMKIYDVASTNSSYGNERVAIQTSFDGLDPLTSSYPSTYPDRSALLLLPRGGNVGIGTTSPAYKLDVKGDIRVAGQIIRESSGYNWFNGRRGALLRETTSSGYHTLWSLKTTDGSWDFGEYKSSGWNNIPLLNYITDTDFSSGNNTTTYQIRFPLDSGTIALTKNIPTSLKNPNSLILKANGTTLAIYDGSSAKEANFTYANVGAASASHTHSNYVTALGTSDNYLTWTKNGSTNNITVPYATTSSYLTNGFSAPWVGKWDCNAPDRVVYSDYGSNERLITNAPSGWNYGTLLELGHTNYRGINGILNILLMWDVAHNTTLPGTLWFRGKDEVNGWAKSWAKVITDLNISSILSNYYTKSETDGKYVTLTTPLTIGGLKTFTNGILFNTNKNGDANLGSNDGIRLFYNETSGSNFPGNYYNVASFITGYTGFLLACYGGADLALKYRHRLDNGTWHPWKTLAFTTDIPSSLKNPYSLTTFGVVYDGSAAKVVSPSNFISLLEEGTAPVTDGTMFVTSFASDSGFADTNNVNVPYKRKAIHLWRYIKTKTDSLYYTESEVNNLLSKKLNTSDFNWTNLPGKLVAGNEFNIVNAGFNGDIWFNYVPINDRSKTATITGYSFGNGAQGYATVTASGFVKNGSSSSYVLLGDGGHQTISSLSVNYANSAGNADTVDGQHLMTQVSNWNTDSLSIFKSSEHETSNAPTTDFTYGVTLRFHRDISTYHTDLVTSLYYDRLFFRRKIEGGYQTWRELIHSGNISSQSVNYANSAGNADTVDGYHVDDILPYGLENLCIGAVASGGQTILNSDGSITTSGNNSDTYFFVRSTENLIAGQIYTVGFYVTGVPSGNTATWNWPFAGQGNNKLVISIQRNGWCWGTGTIPKDIVAGTNIIFDDTERGFYSSINISKFVIVKGRQKAYYTPPISKMSVNHATSSGNADTVDGQHFSYSNSSNSPTYLWATNSNGSSFLAARESISVNYANSAGNADTVDGYHYNQLPYIQRLNCWNAGDSHNANDLLSGTTFAYSTHSNCPTTGTIVAFNCINSTGYPLQLQGKYYGEELWFRNRNGDNGTWQTWRELIHSGNIGSQSVNYANSAGNADTATNAYHLRINSANTWSTWYWVGLSGQPSWLWGSNDGINMYVWNPSNFSVNYANSAGNADTLDGYHANGSNVAPYGHIPTIESDGVMEVGKYIDFHNDNSGKHDFSTRLQSTGNYGNEVNLPSASGTLALTSDIPNPINYYWANVKISTSSSTTTSPTVSNLTVTSSIKMGNISLEHTDEINNSANDGIHLNYRNSGDVSLCVGGGRVGIGTRYPGHKLDVLGDTRTRGFGIDPYYLSDPRLLSTIGLSDGYYYRCLEIGKSTKISCIIADKVPLAKDIRGVLLNFKEGFDGLIVLLKDLEDYGSENGFFWVMPSGCKIIRADGSGTLISLNLLSNAYDDGHSRFFVYSSKYSVWIEFLCA